MNPLPNGETATAIRLEAHAFPAPGMTLDELIQHMADIGNPVLEVDRERGCLKIVDYTEAL